MIALDLDNTIICYNDAFRAAAQELDCLPLTGDTDKTSIKVCALERGGNALWTRLQGLAYGPFISHARLFPGCVDFADNAREELVIISHKTQFPALGPRIDLRQAALDWLASTPLSQIPVHFLDSREEKVACVARLNPRLLIDDLPEILETEGFPATTKFLLFDPHDSHPDWTLGPRLASWQDATAWIALNQFATCQDVITLTALAGGRNNRVWRIDSTQGPFLLKQYSSTDTRDRLGQEWAFLEFLRSIGCKAAPSPIARHSSLRFALLEFIDGVPPNEIGESEILDAVGFFATINAARHLGAHLPPVSEACFSIQEHLDMSARRMVRLGSIHDSLPIHIEARNFVVQTLRPLWDLIHTRISALSTDERTTLLPTEERCLSPSDFGFHNAIRQPDGNLRYIDFEYAGWDDPAKTLVDFTNQPDRILPEPLAQLFLAQTIPLFPNSEALRHRITLLRPLYQFKWACICLNPFLPGHPNDPARSLESQLARAQIMANRCKLSLDSQASHR